MSHLFDNKVNALLKGEIKVHVKNTEVDTVIIGGGLAGLRAAISAREQGGNVAVIVKGKLGRSGCSVMSDGGYATALKQSQDHPKYHFEDTYQKGGMIGDKSLIHALCEESSSRLEEMETLGGSFLKDEKGYDVMESGDHKYPRVVLAENQIGTDLTIPLANLCRDLGIQVFEFHMALELLLNENTVCGVLCLDLKKGDLVVVQSKSTILATGGCGNLFSINSNPNDVTGDGYALAMDAGAELRDMEFIQFYPWRCISPFKSRVLVQPSTFLSDVKLLNSEGERFFEKYDPKNLEATTRAIAARAITQQIRNGLGISNGVKLDVSSLSEAEFERHNPRILATLKSKGLNFKDCEIIVAPEAHYFMGGIRINEHGETSLKGLYAAGEVTGGIHGANRIDSNSLPDTMVFGMRAGKSAAAYSRVTHLSGFDEHQLEKWKIKLEGIGEGKSLLLKSSKELLHEFQSQMDKSLGVIRELSEMEDGLKFIRKLLSTIENQTVNTISEVRKLKELEFMCKVGLLCLTAAILRNESRGAHFRLDFPETNYKDWNKSIILRKQTDEQILHYLA